MKKQIKSIIAVIMAAGTLLTSMGTSVSAEWVKKGSDYYYENSDGTYKTGWIKTSGGDYYYCRKDGKMAKSCTMNINGGIYTFGEDGKAVNKPAENVIKDNTTSTQNSTESKKKTENKNSKVKAEKNQNTFPALVTYGVYCGMSVKDFKALKHFDIFQWDSIVEAYCIQGSYYVFLEDGIVSQIALLSYESYGYKRNQKDLAQAEADIITRRAKKIKTHKNKKLLSDTTTDSYYTDGSAIYKTNYDNVYYVITDISWDTTQDYYYFKEAYCYQE